MQQQPANTDRNRRLNKLAGATVLGRDLADCRKRVNAEIERHRRAQAKARSPYANRFDLKPATTRQRVRKAVAAIRAVEARVEAKYGAYGLPVAAEPAFLLAAE